LDILTSFYEFWKFKQFLKFKTIEIELKFAAQCQAKTGPLLQCSPAARWWLAGGKVLGLTTTTKRQMRPARRAEAGLTEVVARQQGGAAAHDGVLTRGRVGGDSD
jgi:hypothetical protein